MTSTKNIYFIVCVCMCVQKYLFRNVNLMFNDKWIGSGIFNVNIYY